MKTQIFLAITFLSLLWPEFAFSSGFALSVRVGSTGLGLELVKSISPALNARVGGNFFNYSLDGVEEGYVRYDLDLKMRTGSFLVDWYPWDSIFRLCGGAYYNKNEMDITLTSATSYTIGSKTYQPDELGRVAGAVGFTSIAPYIGIGLGNAVAAGPAPPGKRLSLMIDLGMIYQSAPQLTLHGEGLMAPTAEQEPIIEDNVRWAKWYPNFSIGLAWKF